MSFKTARPFISYFRSGWAFFLPYLTAYLLYAWLKWPVNPAAYADGAVTGINESVASFSHSFIPSLLHVYWFLHATHFILAVVALITWWQDKRSLQSGQRRGDKAGAALRRDLARSAELATTRYPLLATLAKAAPWVFLALIFYIPGIYLEWPSDPWEHLRRINEWHAHSAVLQHSSWYKSSYFLPYSLTGFTTGLPQLNWLSFYYTAVCLLLSWQYYRLARAVGLRERASFIFVLLNAFTFGNNIFSFYRYYGLSSSIFAQLGAVALTRIALETVRIKDEATSCKPLIANKRWSLVSSRWSLVPSTLCLITLIAFNHIQGLGIAGIGILAVVIWRLIHWKRYMLGWLSFTAGLASAAVVLWFPQNPALDEVYRPQGWLTAWYGFNLFTPSSPAFDRSLQILGAFGILNLLLALWLVVRRNHIAGWLTLLPVLVLALPCFALPLANFVTASAPGDDILIFHRLLLAVPLGLALVVTFGNAASAPTSSLQSPASSFRSIFPFSKLLVARYPLLCAGLAGAVALSPGASAYSRFWHGLQTTATDLNLRPLIAAWTPTNLALAGDDNTLAITSPLGKRVQEAFAPGDDWRRWRQIRYSLGTAEVGRALTWIHLIPSSSLTANTPDAPVSWPHGLRVIANLTEPGTSWLNYSGAPPETTVSTQGLVVGNPSGLSTHAFARKLIPLNRSKRYQLSVALRQSGDPRAINYLAVAWYDLDGNLLASNAPPPAGAGNPFGWSNGTYSYFGVDGQSAPENWTTYSIAFGLGEQAEIPAQAAFMRAGALLNYNASLEANVWLANLALREKPPYQGAIHVISDFSAAFTPASLSARLSGHWSPAKVVIDSASTAELRTAASSAAHD